MKVRNIIKNRQHNGGYGWGCPRTWYVVHMRAGGKYRAYLGGYWKPLPEHLK